MVIQAERVTTKGHEKRAVYFMIWSALSAADQNLLKVSQKCVPKVTTGTMNHP